jgi:sugar-specific transcriptional regulator TrmB
MSAGLTGLEARVFLTLCNLQKATVSEISKKSSIDRSNIYKTLQKLEDLKLVERELDTTARYNPVPLPVAISILTNIKKQEYRKTVKSLEKLAKQVDVFRTTESQMPKEFFKIHPGDPHVFTFHWQKLLSTVQKSVDLIITEYREPKNDDLWNIYKKLFHRGVNVRCIIDRSLGNHDEFKMRIKQFEYLLSYPNVEIKICSECKKPYGMVVDGKNIILFLDDVIPLKSSRTLWTNNKQITRNFTEHFEISWKKAKIIRTQYLGLIFLNI